MTRTVRNVAARLTAAALVFTAAPARADWGGLNMSEGVTELSRMIYSLHMTIFWWCVAIGAVVFGWMLYSLVVFRKSKGARPDTALVHSTKAEIIWTVIPVGILVIMAIPAARTLVAIEDARETELSIKVTGYQWKWEYEYLGGSDVGFFSTISRQSDAARQLGSGIDPYGVDNYLVDVDNPLVVPAGTKVRLLLTAQDVIHAWWVPAFGMKKDAIPGFVNEIWFRVDEDKTGLYRGQCAELCGRDHAFMPIVVDVRSKTDFAAWLEEQKARRNPTTVDPESLQEPTAPPVTTAAAVRAAAG